MAGVLSPLAAPRSREPRGRMSRPRILCVDDDQWVLEGLTDVLGRAFSVTSATSPLEALERLKRMPEAFAIVLSDMRMPGMPGSELLRMARITAPDAVRILLTGDADVPAAVRAINDGQVFRFLIKPCESQELMRACAAALGQHRLQTSERVLVQDTLRGCVDALAEVLSLTNPALFGRARRAKALAGELARAAGLRDWAEVEVAAMLENLGAVILPPHTAEKLHAGQSLSEAETAVVRRVPEITRQLLEKIPRLDGVLEILAHCRPQARDEHHAADGGAAVPRGAGVLRIALDFVELEADQTPTPVALGAMRDRQVYDPDLLELFALIAAGGASAEVREVPLRELRVGMILADEARSSVGDLLLACGQPVTQRLIDRLENLGQRAVREPLRVYDPDDRRSL